MNKMKVMTIVGTRPEVIRLSRTISLLDTFCDHTLVHTGQNYDYELNQVFFDDLGIRKPDKFLGAAGKNFSETIGNIMIAVDSVFNEYSPEALLILGDTNSSLTAIIAKRKKIPIFHMEAGNRCFDLRVPEEINRKIVDHISDINLTYSSIAREHLVSEGIHPGRIIKVGSPMMEVLDFYSKKIDESVILEELGLHAGEFFVASSHREENIDSQDGLVNLILMLNAVAARYQYPIVVSVHPRLAGKVSAIGLTLNPLIQFHKPFGFFDYIKLQKNAFCVLSDSGTIAEESSILNFSAINLRDTHERPEGFEEGGVIFTGYRISRVLQALEIIGNEGYKNNRVFPVVADYDVLNVSSKILNIIQSYTDLINREVWHKRVID